MTTIELLQALREIGVYKLIDSGYLKPIKGNEYSHALDEAVEALENQPKYEKALKIMASGWVYKSKSDYYCKGCKYYGKPAFGCNGSSDDCMNQLIDYFKKQAGLEK